MNSEFGMRANRRTFLRHAGVGLGSIAAVRIGSGYIGNPCEDVSRHVIGIATSCA